MKSNIYILLFITCFTLLTISCDKQEPLHADPPKVVRIRFAINTTKPLEFVYKDSVVAVGLVDNSGSNTSATTLLKIEGQNGEIQIREKGSVNIISTRAIETTPFEQAFAIYYDGSKIYNQLITYQVKGYASSGELEFLLDGNVIETASSAIDKTLTVLINENTTRELQVRKKGTTDILITKILTSSPTSGQSLSFFFDGTSMVDNIQINPPANMANMAINAQFKSTITSTLGVFTGGNAIDLVFYTRNKTTNVIAKASPEIRITLPTNGDFASFELPPLPGANFEYKFDICARGLNSSPYDVSAAAVKAIALNEGKSTLAGTAIQFEAGQSKLFLIKDARQLRTSPAPISSIFIGQITDLSQYFK
ncbi:hypothetical protein [Pedobacter metabolipauper]|nr:hypothetical protein [Pedobacter metabolipauper]